MRAWWRQTFEALASVRLAVITMAALAVACIAATFYEAARGTAATQRLFWPSTSSSPPSSAIPGRGTMPASWWRTRGS